MGNTTLKVFIRLALFGLLAYTLIAHSGDLRTSVSQRDSIAYWAAGKLLLHGNNPYDASMVLALESEQGYRAEKPLVLRTPPWSLFMVFPLGLMSAFWAWVSWIGASLGSLLVAMRLCWKMYGGDTGTRNFFLVAGYTFAPVPACLVAGQMGILLLLGVVLFLRFEADRPFLAGAALILPFAKPHLLSLFWLILVFWAVARKRFAVAGGLATAFLVATAISLTLDHNIFQDYRQMLYQASIGNEFIPALSGVLRLLFFHHLFWVQFIPVAFGLAWCVWFWWVNRTNWSWREHGPALMVVSVLTTPYSWITDEVILLPAILQATMWIFSPKWRMTLKTRLAITIFVCLNGLLLLILFFKIPFSTGIYFWSSLVWFAWYSYGRLSAQRVKE